MVDHDAGRAPPRPADDRGRPGRRLPLPQPQELGAARLPADGGAPALARQARRPALRRGRRPAARPALEPGRGTPRARRRCVARRRPGAAPLAGGGRGRRRRRHAGHLDAGAGPPRPGIDAARGRQRPRSGRVRRLAALRAAASPCGVRGRPARGGPGVDVAGRARRGGALRDAGRRDEPARREQPGAAHPAAPTSWRRAGSGEPAGSVHAALRVRARHGTGAGRPVCRRGADRTPDLDRWPTSA